jgi:hypothetical protein
MRPLFLACALALGCRPASGDVTVLLEPEASITEGIAAGSEEDQIVDGWSVAFSRYLVAIGDVRLGRSAGDLEARAPEVFIADLSAIGGAGVPLASLEAIETGRWDRVSFRTPAADASAMIHASASEVDAGEMIANGWTYWLQGTLTNGTEQIAFDIGVATPAEYGPCEAEDGLSGLTVTEGGTSFAITIHGDHLFFDTFPSGAEVIERRAQWLADCDLDESGTIDAAELARVDAADVFPSETYNLAGSPYPIDTALDFARSQLSTQGHFQGEGECPWAVLP